MLDNASLENQFLKLTVSADAVPTVSVLDKRTGQEWATGSSAFVFHCWESAQFTARVSHARRADGWEFRLIPEAERIALQCTWPRAACGFRIFFRLNAHSLEVSVPPRRLVENNPSSVRQMAIDIMADFGAARTGDNGFMLVPRERGVICRFNKTGLHTTNELFYSNGGRSLTAPVFGMAHGKGGFLGIVDDCEFNAQLCVAANCGDAGNENRIHPRLLLRFHTSDPLNEDGENRFIYRFLESSDATPVGMAKSYRGYLLGARGEKTLSERCSSRQMLAKAISAVTVQISIAEKRRLTRMTGDGELVVRTKFDEAAQITRELKKAGVETAAIVLAGWNSEGRDGIYPTRFPVEGAAGGSDAMARVAKAISESGYLAGALDNYTDMYRRAATFNEELAALQCGGEPWRSGMFAGGQAYVICPTQALVRHAQRDMRRLSDLGFRDMLFLDHCPGPGVLSCYSSAHSLNRANYARAIAQLIESAQKSFGFCRISGPAVFAALRADTCMMPVNDTPAIGGLTEDWFTDEHVPFLNVALHGIVLLAGDAREHLLSAIEAGAAPVYEVATADADKIVQHLREFYPRYVTELAPLATETIESHERIGDEATAVGYSNGATVVVNRGGSSIEFRGKKTNAQDFAVVR